MPNKFFCCFVAIFTLSARHVSCEDALDSQNFVLSESALRKVMTDTCNQVNAFYKSEHFPIPVPSPDGCSFSYTDNKYYKVKTGKFEATDKADLAAELLATSGDIISFNNWKVFNATYGEGAPLYVQRQPARWTGDHAISIATKFANIFVKPWGVKLGKPVANFYWPSGDSPKIAAGQWTVMWPRVSLSGIPFGSNGVNVSLTEKYGPHSIGLGLTAEYDEIPISPITQKAALIEARKGLEKILAWGPAQRGLPGVQIQGEPLVRLLIVQPNDMTAQKSVLDAMHSNQHKARLAWVATYSVCNPIHTSIRAAVSVEIDAKDGSFLGGYF